MMALKIKVWVRIHRERSLFQLYRNRVENLIPRFLYALKDILLRIRKIISVCFFFPKLLEIMKNNGVLR